MGHTFPRNSLELLGFRIFYSESFYSDALHHLIFQRSVLVVGSSLRDLVYIFLSLDHLSKRRISAVKMRACLVHDKEVWSRKAAYLLDILALLEFVDNKLTTIFVLNSTE